MKKCENCKFSDTLYPPAILKCRLKKITVSFKDYCEKFEGKTKDNEVEFLKNIFGIKE